MSYMKPGLPWLYDDVTGDIVGVKDADGQDSLFVSQLGNNTITVGAGGKFTDIQTAINSITDNLPVNYNTGTVSVTNGSATITFSVAPPKDKVVAGRDLFTIDGVRYYNIKAGPTVLNGTVFTLLETYQGATNTTAAFSIIKPNTRTIVLLPGVYDYTTDVTSANTINNIITKPYVNIVGLDRDSTIIRRNQNDGTPAALITLAHSSTLSNLTIDSVDGHFNVMRMGLSADATSQTQAMAGSRWQLNNVSLLNKDPNGIDGGADYWFFDQYHNADVLLFDKCYFEHCWDGFTFTTAGGRLLVTFNNPIIYKTPLPQGETSTGATFVRNGVSGTSTSDVVMVNPVYNQVMYAAGEVANDGAGGTLSRAGGTNGMLMVGQGGTGLVLNPAIDMDVGLSKGRNAAIGIFGSTGQAASTLICIGGYINIAGAGGGNATQDHVDGAFNDLDGCTLTVSGTRITSGMNGVRSNNATAVVNLQGGARIQGTTNSLLNTAGTMNKSANVSAVGTQTGTITAAET